MDGQKEACYTDKEYGEQARIREKRKGLFISVFFIIRAPALVCLGKYPKQPNDKC